MDLAATKELVWDTHLNYTNIACLNAVIVHWPVKLADVEPFFPATVLFAL